MWVVLMETYIDIWEVVEEDYEIPSPGESQHGINQGSQGEERQRRFGII